MRDEWSRDSSLIPHPSSLLVIRLSALGDVIHTIPAVVALRDRYDIDWVVEEPYRELVAIVARVRDLPVSLKRWSPAQIRRARRSVRGHDVAVDFQGLIKSALLARASGARDRYGFAAEFIREKPAAWLVNRHVTIDPTKHVVEWNLQLARALEPSLQLPRVDFSVFASPTAAERRIVLIPGAGRRDKQWPVQRFRELAGYIGKETLVAWGPGERSLAEAVGSELAPPTDLRELARLLRDARLVIAGDTGPLHLAAALGTPVVGLYGPTNPRRNGPYGQIENCVETFSTSRSMTEIAVDRVVRKMEEVLSR
ncbi:MAG TPA: glycosyltransferase family 9 protein [Thermoanaerobaculia bacterium]